MEATFVRELMLIVVLLPAMIGLLRRSPLALVVGLVFSGIAALLYASAPLVSIGLWAAGCLAAGVLSLRTTSRADEERRHQEVLAALHRQAAPPPSAVHVRPAAFVQVDPVPAEPPPRRGWFR